MQRNSPAISDPEMKNICATCGTRYPALSESCGICDDERQYVPATGQKWTSYADIGKAHTIRFTKASPDVYALRLHPTFGIGQRAHLIISPGGNLLWDCISYLDEPTVAFIQSYGGLKGIAISHPHYYSIMASWAETFQCPIFLHSGDRNWVKEGLNHIQLFEESEYTLWDGIKILHTGGHFAGSTILHAPGMGASGTLFVGDSLQISLSRKFISMMYSYPNVIPLKLKEILHIDGIVDQLDFDSMYGAFEWQNIERGAKKIFKESIDKYREIYQAS